MRPLTWSIFLLAGMSWPALGQAPEWETTRVAEDVFQFRFRGHNGMFVVTADGVVAFDPISVEAAPHFGQAIRDAAPGQPLRAIVYSHHHADHSGGAAELMASMDAEVPVIAHVLARDHLDDEAPANVVLPSIVFRDRMNLYFGGRAIELHYLGPSHSDNIIVARIPDVGVVFAVDFVSNDRVGYRDLASHIFPDFFEALRRLEELAFRTVVFGHGSIGDHGSIRRQIAYYDDLREAVRDAVDRGLSEDEAAADVNLPAYAEWSAYADWFALNVRGMYRWLASD